jgi:type VI secretion system secreted protein Hcp
MAADIYLKIESPPIDGEAQDDKHKDWIEVSSFSFGVTNAGSGAVGSGSGTGIATLDDLGISKFVDKASPGLFQDCCTGKHHAKATLSVRKAGGNPIEYLKYEMEEVFITHVSTSASAASEQLASENVHLNFAKMTLTYTEQKKDGSAGKSIPKWYSVKEHKFG